MSEFLEDLQKILLIIILDQIQPIIIFIIAINIQLQPILTLTIDVIDSDLFERLKNNIMN